MRIVPLRCLSREYLSNVKIQIYKLGMYLTFNVIKDAPRKLRDCQSVVDREERAPIPVSASAHCRLLPLPRYDLDKL